MKRPLVTWLPALCVIALAACSTPTTVAPAPELPEGQGILYLHRPKAMTFSDHAAVFEIDGVRRATLGNGSCAALPLSTGPHALKQQWAGPMAGTTEFETRPIFLPVEIVQGAPVHVTLRNESTGEGTPGHAQWSLVQGTESKSSSRDARCTRIGEGTEGAVPVAK